MAKIFDHVLKKWEVGATKLNLCFLKQFFKEILVFA